MGTTDGRTGEQAVSYERRKREPERPDEYPAFNETLTTGLEDTVRNLRILRERSPGDDEARRWQFKAVDDLTTEVKTLRHELGNLVRALDKKASLINQAKFEQSLTAKLDVRIDKIRNITMWAIGILFVVDGLVKVIH